MSEGIVNPQNVILLLVWLANVFAIGGVLLARRRDPSATLAWILALIFLPVVGVLFYFLFGVTRAKSVARRSLRADQRLRAALAGHAIYAPRKPPPDHDVRTWSQLRLGDAIAGTPASTGNAVQILHNAAATYRSMLQAIDEARDHVHVQFYIIQPDRTGEALRERLIRRARDGVTVRVLYDSVGSINLPRDFWRPLEEVGGRAVAFRPVMHQITLRRRDRMDFRNHRKIIVVDGRVGFTGGINIGREYLGLDPEVGHWRDTHVRIEGPATMSLQHTFASDWLFETDELLDDARYFPPPADVGGCVVQVVDTGPDQPWSSMEYLYSQAIMLARERAWITSPYFIPSATVESALTMAALRGVDVRLLLPSRSDSRLVNLAARSYYRDLLHAGVRIYEYQRGFVHAKTMVIDTWMATVGSANMDIRSFDLNFELNAFMFEPAFAHSMAEEFLRDLDHAQEITMAHEQRVGYAQRLMRSTARLLSPLL